MSDNDKIAGVVDPIDGMARLLVEQDNQIVALEAEAERDAARQSAETHEGNARQLAKALRGIWDVQQAFPFESDVLDEVQELKLIDSAGALTKHAAAYLPQAGEGVGG